MHIFNNLNCMKKGFAVLFDLDGVILDTERQYDVFWSKMGKEYQMGIDNFENVVKGITEQEILSKFFSHFTKEEQQEVLRRNYEFELQMDLVFIPGVCDFLDELKVNQIKMALVTSSGDKKLDYIFSKLPLRAYFDSVVSANRITHGKPHPMPFLQAASDLNVSPENCFVFEDSFNGIKSGNAAGMKVIGLSTTNPRESIENDVVKVIPDFSNFHLNDLEALRV